jgi:pimeloyl-ACP methyl ester carboxylesterase
MSTTPVSRRDAVAALAAGPLLSLTNLVTLPAAPATFVLVHGAWHGGWCWKKVTPLLRAAGHEVFAPTLTGLGERSHLLTRDVGLETHITDIEQVLEYEDLRNVVLVGHSYAGMVITGVGDRAADRIGQLVYVDAFLPENGKALTDYSLRAFPPITDDSWRDRSRDPQDFGVTDDRDVAWMKARLRDMPGKCLRQPLQLHGNSLSAIKGAYILCTQRADFREAAERAKQRGYRYHELPSAGHDVMVTRPRELARLLMELV